MGKTNFTFVSPLRATLLMLVAFGLAGFNAAFSQCAAPSVTIDEVTTSTITVTVASGSADLDHTFRIRIDKDGDADPTNGPWNFFSELINTPAGTYTFGLGGLTANDAPLPCNARYRLRVREYCDDMEGNTAWTGTADGSYNGDDSGNGENPPGTGTEFYTYSAMYQAGPYVTQTLAQRPTCPGACDGSVTLNIDADLACCPGAAFDVVLTQDNIQIWSSAADVGNDLAPNTNYDINGIICDGGALEFTITETDGCTLEEDPITRTFTGGAGIDTEDPFY